MTKYVFKASNGNKINEEDGWLTFNSDNKKLAPHAVIALREYFRDEYDKEIGVWRDPAHPDIIVQQWTDQPDLVQVVKLGNGIAYAQVTRVRAAMGLLDPMLKAAQAYFETHPDPKPWHRAKQGEVWMLKLRGSEESGWRYSLGNGWISLDDPFCLTLSRTDPSILDGRRIYPEEK